jgi:hypothetical protein
MCGPIFNESSVDESNDVELAEESSETTPSRVFAHKGGNTIAVVTGAGKVVLVKGKSGKIIESSRDYADADALLASGKYEELGATWTGPVPTSAPADTLATRLAAAEAATGRKLGDAVIVYGEKNFVGRVTGFARVNGVNFKGGTISNDGEPERAVIVTDVDDYNHVIDPSNLNDFNLA